MTDTAPGGLTPEQQARREIDAQLVACGWVVQDYKHVAVAAAQGVAVREVPTDAGRADYVLFLDRQAVGVIEAKPAGTTLTGVEPQTLRYRCRSLASCTRSRWAARCRLATSQPATRPASPAGWILYRPPSGYSPSTVPRRWPAGWRIASRPGSAPSAPVWSYCPTWTPEGSGPRRPRQSGAWRRRCGTTGRGRSSR